MSSTNNNSIVDQVTNAASTTLKNASDGLSQAANWATGRTEEAQKEAGKQAVKSDQTTIGQKLDGASDYVTHGAKEAKADTKKNYYENKADARDATS